MEINQLLRMGVDLIKERPYGNPALESTLLLSHLLNVDKIYIYSHGKDQVPLSVANRFLNLMKRRAKGYPIQYLINTKEFMALDFYVEEGVLIPRFDTEVLVDYILKYMEEEYRGKAIRVLELGIGSGAIALSIAYYNRSALVYGVDIHDGPLKVARINKERLKLTNVRLFKSDLFREIDELNQRFHIIVSNPPYIARGDLDTLQEEVREYEPLEALDGGEDGLDYYRKIIPPSKDYLEDGGMLIFEIGSEQGGRLTEMMKEEGFKGVEVLKDLQDLDRIIFGTVEQGRDSR